MKVSLFCKLDGVMARWEEDGEVEDIDAMLVAVRAEVAKHKGTHSTVLALILTPVVNTPKY